MSKHPLSLALIAIVCFAGPLLFIPLALAENPQRVWAAAGLQGQEVLALSASTEPVNESGGAGILASLRGLGIWRLAESTADWQPADFLTPADMWQGITVHHVFAVPAASRGTLLALDERGQILRSHDDGRTWETLAEVDNLANGDILLASLRGAYRLSGDVLTRSGDAGASWRITGRLPAGHTVTHASAGLLGDGSLLLGTDAGVVLRSLDAGATWEELRGRLPGQPIRAFAGDGDNALFAAADAGVLMSEDGGGSWHFASPNMQGRPSRCLLVDGMNRDTLYVGLDQGGVYVSTDRGATWQSLGRGLGRRTVTTLVMDVSREALWAGTTDGVWRISLPDALRATATPTTGPEDVVTTPAVTGTSTPTPIPPTAAATRTSTFTPKPPSATPTETVFPTATETATDTPAPPTSTPRPRPTYTSTRPPTETPFPTSTPVPATWTPPPEEPPPPQATATPEQPKPTPTPPR